jgi:hypothetical protein
MASGATDEVIEEACARAAHEVLAAYAAVFRQETKGWAFVDQVPMRRVVKAVLGGADAQAIHMLRCQRLELEGWTYGPFEVLEADGKKCTPLLVPFDKLPEAQALKEILMVTTINAMALALGHTSARAQTVRIGG